MYHFPQIQIKRATVKVRQGKIYVGKLPSEVSKIWLFFFAPSYLYTWHFLSRAAQIKIFAHILSSLALSLRSLLFSSWQHLIASPTRRFLTGDSSCGQGQERWAQELCICHISEWGNLKKAGQLLFILSFDEMWAESRSLSNFIIRKNSERTWCAKQRSWSNR